MKFENGFRVILVLTLFLPSIVLFPIDGYVVFDSTSYSMHQRDYWPTLGWQNSTPAEQGMDASTLQAMIDHIVDEDLDVHSVIVIRNGYIVLEEYPNPFQGQSRTTSFDGTHYLYSTTKSFTSCMIGIAIDKGFLDNTSQTVLSLFPDMTFDNVDERKERITIDDLLTMRSGLPWDETSAPFSSPDNDVWQVNFNSSGGVQFVLDQLMESEPGEYFHYNTGASHVLSGIVHETTNMSMLEFAAENLFAPLGIDRYFWPSDTQGVTFGGFDLQLRPLDMAKFGFLFLNNGSWDGEQIVSSDWVHNTTTTVTTLNSISGYSRQWWTMPDYGVYHTAGLYGQYIFVAPELDIVAVFTSGYGANDIDENPQMVRDYILPAVIGYTLPNSLGALNTLQSIVIVATSIIAITLVVQYVRKKR
ncbi:MAG: class C beta-lactamase-related serine hydrolase [Candidatus Thorarchaeota archaeon]|nr:MAG: class C beta-lactamase-related serine hydrolase [Candidatus Thorarchaeota archaeon]